VDSIYEAITITQVVTDADGSLKIKQIEEFVDSDSLIKTIEAYKKAGEGK